MLPVSAVRWHPASFKRFKEARIKGSTTGAGRFSRCRDRAVGMKGSKPAFAKAEISDRPLVSRGSGPEQLRLSAEIQEDETRETLIY
jgi:hypothetical protein